MTTQGVILIATGAPFYGRMAYNLAVSIKAVEDMPVMLLYNGNALSHLSDRQKDIFDEIKLIDTESFAAKLTLLDHSPYDQTLYVDCDTVWMPGKKPSDLFKELEGVVFTSITEGFFDYETGENKGNAMYHFWADPAEAQAAWGLTGRFYQWRSEIMYFTREAADLFTLAKKVYNNPMVKVKQFAGHVPDELAINIAASKLV